jgi:penicillin-insensitive murein endopeptidase
MKKIPLILVVIILFCYLVILWGNDIAIYFENDQPSTSSGTVADGKLENGKRLPSGGENFVTYSRLGSLIGRNGVHSKIRDVILDAYNQMYRDHPEYQFMIGECSWLSGGSMKPHRTHQNGTSVDFMVPIRNDDNEIDLLPAHLFNKFGYNVEFDSLGVSESMRIDFDAIGMHLFYLYASCKTHDVEIDLVIFDPQLQSHLFATEWGARVKDLMRFTTQSVWIRHDEHYHVNFKL